MSAAKSQQTLMDVPPEKVDALAKSDGGVLSMIERLAALPDFDVAKLERLIDMQERILKHNAKAAYDSAFAVMQPDIPQIDEKGKILNKDRTTVRSTYAKLEDIHLVIKPILARHGFAIRHRTEWPSERPGIIRIVGILSHKDGHSEESAFEAPADKSEYRTDIQSMGSTVSYGRRYTTLDLLNIATRGEDKDGANKLPEAPEGFQEYWDSLKAATEKGTTSLEAAWACSADEPYKSYRKYIAQHGTAEMAALRTKAKQVKA